MAVHEANQARRCGRGRLSSLDRLPAAADDAVAWANAQLGEHNLTQTEILQELNSRLVALGISPVSRSAFSRHSVRLTIDARIGRAAQGFAIDLFDLLRIDAPDSGYQLVADALRFVLVQLLIRPNLDTRKVEAVAQLLTSIMAEDDGDD